jgi:membrane protein DedA with SNARE-associated domain
MWIGSHTRAAIAGIPCPRANKYRGCAPRGTADKAAWGSLAVDDGKAETLLLVERLVDGVLAVWEYFAVFDPSKVAHLFSLLLLPFAHEDLAIMLGGYIVVNNLMPVGLVVVSLYGGMLASDFALYGIGAGARHLPWLSRLAVGKRVRDFGEILERNLFGLVVLCRVVPGVVFIAFVACGWTRVPLLRFTGASILSSAIYLPLMLGLTVVFGDALDDHAGLWTWPFLGVAWAALTYVRQRVFAFQVSPKSGSEMASATRYGGMPALAGLPRTVALAERIPAILFYFPLVLSWIGFALRHRCFMLPTAANPQFAAGGMGGAPKSERLAGVAVSDRRWVADFVVFQRAPDAGSLYTDLNRALTRLADAGLQFPLVAKPDIGWQGYGVRRIDDATALRDYLRGFPAGERLILQRFVPHLGEAAAVYARLPGEQRGRILSLSFRYSPHVVGDGLHTVRALIERDQRAQWKARLHLGHDPSHQGPSPEDLSRVPARGDVVRIALIGSQRAGGLYRDARRHITSELETRFDAIASGMGEFHYGVFNLRFGSIEELMQAENFSIVDIGGVGGDALDAWDPVLSVADAFHRLRDRQRILFLIGARNRARGFKPAGLGDVIGRMIRRALLSRRYPASA